LPPISPGLQLARASFVSVLALSVAVLLELVVVSRLSERSAQGRAFAQFRIDVAAGTAPLGPAGADNHELKAGTPVAYLEIPAIGLHQVVVEGTTSADLFLGPGHRRDTPLPGQAGVSVVLGRRASFGGPFARLSSLKKDATIRVTTGQGQFVYKVAGLRREGDPVPPPLATGTGRLILATAAGSPFIPNGVLRVDADLTAPALPGPARLVDSHTLPANEQLMAADPSTLWALALWLQALLAAVVGAAWAWHRWGRVQAWVVCLPVVLLVGISAAEQAARLLPNLL
jgi:hypothetical protein